MIKAPFTFDIDYFSVVVVYISEEEEHCYPFEDQHEKQLVLKRLRRSGKVSQKQLTQIDEKDCYNCSQQVPHLYIIVQNNQNQEFFCSINRNDNIKGEIKTFFPSLLELYKYIKKNCREQNIMATKKGHVVIQYVVDEISRKIKVQNYPTKFTTKDFDDIWIRVADEWNKKGKNSLKQIFEPVTKGNISVFEPLVKVEHNNEPQKGEEVPKLEASERQLRKEEYLRTPEKKRKMDSYTYEVLNRAPRKVRRARMRKMYSSDEYSSDERVMRVKRYEPYVKEQQRQFGRYAPVKRMKRARFDDGWVRQERGRRMPKKEFVPLDYEEMYEQQDEGRVDEVKEQGRNEANSAQLNKMIGEMQINLKTISEGLVTLNQSMLKSNNLVNGLSSQFKQSMAKMLTKMQKSFTSVLESRIKKLRMSENRAVKRLQMGSKAQTQGFMYFANKEYKNFANKYETRRKSEMNRILLRQWNKMDKKAKQQYMVHGKRVALPAENDSSWEVDVSGQGEEVQMKRIKQESQGSQEYKSKQISEEQSD